MVKLALGLWIAALLAAERMVPATHWPEPQSPRLIRNVMLGAVLIIASPAVLWAVAAVRGDAAPLIDLPRLLGTTLALPLQFLILDIWVYWTHRAYHRVPLLWRLHGAHHLDEQLDVTSSFRFHLGEIIVSGLARLIPCLALGIAPATLLAFEALLTACAAFHHSNIALPPRLERMLSAIIVTPAIHWVHHHRVRADTDSNYAAILSVWDRLFGSRSATARTPDMPIGAQGEPERDLGGLLVYPLEARR